MADSAVGISLALDTITHQTEDELVDRVVALTHERDIAEIVIGLPLLPSGDEGSQVEVVRSIVERLQNKGLKTHVLDERYSTPKKGSHADPDSASACQILQVFLERLDS